MYLTSSPYKFDEKVPVLFQTVKAYVDSVLVPSFFLRKFISVISLVYFYLIFNS